MKYQVTEKQCQKRIEENGNLVCSRCGRDIVPMKTVDNSGQPTYWSGCMYGQTHKGAWGHFDNGVKKETYKLAYKLILEDGLYLSMDKERGMDFDYQFECGVTKMCGMLNNIGRMRNNKPRNTKAELRKDYNKYYK